MPKLAIISLPDHGCKSALIPEGMTPRTGRAYLCEWHGTQYIGNCRGVSTATGDTMPPLPPLRLLRQATSSDKTREAQNRRLANEALKAFTVENAGAPQAVQAILVRFSFDRKKLILYYRTEQPFDGRRSIASLKRRFGAEVELKQIGVRDEAALLGGIGDCGRQLCCASWMHNFPPINVRMARTQELALTPAAINGCCGRLKCCLRHEYEVYRSAAAALPRLGAHVTLDDGNSGSVSGRNILTGMLTLRMETGRILKVAAARVASVPDGSNAPVAPTDNLADKEIEESDDADQDHQWAESGTAGPT